MLHCMIDLETLSQSPTAAVISIGACTFDRTGVKDTFKVNIKPETSKELGMTISADTVQWWSDQSKAAQDSVFLKAVPAKFALKEFHAWYSSHPIKKIWSQGISFDLPIIEHAFKKADLTIPWKYWESMDSRTIFSMFGYRSDMLHRKYGSIEGHHDALEDCKVQVLGLIDILDAMGWNDQGSPIKL